MSETITEQQIREAFVALVGEKRARLSEIARRWGVFKHTGIRPTPQQAHDDVQWLLSQLTEIARDYDRQLYAMKQDAMKEKNIRSEFAAEVERHARAICQLTSERYK